MSVDEALHDKQPDSGVARRPVVMAMVPLPAVLLGLGMIASPAASAVTAVADHYSTPQSVLLTGVNVLSNDVITPNTTPLVVAYGAAAHGTNSIAPNGALTYQPTAGYVGPDQFFYAASDGSTQSSATVFIDVTTPSPVPVLAPAMLGGLAALVAWFGVRSRRD